MLILILFDLILLSFILSKRNPEVASEEYALAYYSPEAVDNAWASQHSSPAVVSFPGRRRRRHASRNSSLTQWLSI